ncbi:MAG TPA: hypothetical protein IAD04_03855 [Candidatus Caccosoma faecigallinarum]|uniref:YozE SAM-like domain-containing protein n=1 Tax=Candidatus Caccosoma faecigallinarum TaxID=2840720 RepID=A0A9D1G9Z9_9FIRM|nr:hypothetical protein [Candidatus Caccosoma faecigallinarum]
MKFYDWILKFDKVDLPIGDLARDIENDANFPKDLATWSELENYLPASEDAVYETAKNAFNYFLSEFQ